MLKDENYIRQNNAFNIVERQSDMHEIPANMSSESKRTSVSMLESFLKVFYNFMWGTIMKFIPLTKSIQLFNYFLLSSNTWTLLLHFSTDTYTRKSKWIFASDSKIQLYSTWISSFKTSIWIYQAPKKWNAKINQFLHDLSFTCCPHEPFLY